MSNRLDIEINGNRVIPNETSSECSLRPNSSTVEESLINLEDKFETFGAAKSANKLYTSRNISLGTGASGSASFNGENDITVPVTDIKESYLTWGGKNFSNSYGCIDAAMIPELNANRFAFPTPEAITVEYSRDGGVTWIDYESSDDSKRDLFTRGFDTKFTIGKADSTNKATSKYMLRITLDVDEIPLYTTLNKFAIYLSTNGSTGCYCTIDASLESSPTEWVNFANKVSVSGWSGWNIINILGLTTYSSNSDTQYGLIRFTFGCTGGSTTYNGLEIKRIMGFGGVGWSVPSNVARNGQMYSYDSNQNVTFPNKIIAKEFSGIVANASKVNNHTVESDVPPNAIFTDNNTWKPNSATSEGYVASGSGQINKVWKTDANGVPGWRTDEDTVYSNMVAATANDDGEAGLVPAPVAGKQNQYLRGDGTWAIPTNTVYTHPTTSGNKHIPSGGSSGQVLGWASDGTAKWIANNSSGGYIDLGQFNNNGRTININTYKPYSECDSKGDDTTWFVPNDRNSVAWIRSTDNTGTNPSQFGSSEFWFYFRSTMINGMPLQEIIVYSGLGLSGNQNVYLQRAYCNSAWTDWWGDTDYLKLVGGVMTGPINFSSGNPIQMKPASWTSYVQTLICDGNVKVGVNNFSSLWSTTISLIMLSTASTYLRWKSGNGMYFQAITDSSGNIDTKLAITSDNKLLSYHLPIYEVINGATYRMINVNDSANLHIGGNTSTGNNNIAAIFVDLLNVMYGFYSTAFRVIEEYDGKVSCGGGAARWSQVYAKNATISTSDKNLKHDITDIDDKLLELFFKIKSKTYYFNDGDRIHIGLIAQDFEESMKELGLSVDDYGMICKDLLYEYTEFDEDGVGIEESKVPKKDDDGNLIYRYSFRYSELITLTVQVVQNQQKEIDQLKKDNEDLRSELDTMKSEMEKLKNEINEIKSSLSK